MSHYQPRISKQSEDSYFALIVRIDGSEERVIHGDKGRHFTREKAALKSTSDYISKHCQ